MKPKRKRFKLATIYVPPSYGGSGWGNFEDGVVMAGDTFKIEVRHEGERLALDVIAEGWRPGPSGRPDKEREDKE